MVGVAEIAQDSRQRHAGVVGVRIEPDRAFERLLGGREPAQLHLLQAERELGFRPLRLVGGLLLQRLERQAARRLQELAEVPRELARQAFSEKPEEITHASPPGPPCTAPASISSPSRAAWHLASISMALR